MISTMLPLLQAAGKLLFSNFMNSQFAYGDMAPRACPVFFIWTFMKRFHASRNPGFQGEKEFSDLKPREMSESSDNTR